MKSCEKFIDCLKTYLDNEIIPRLDYLVMKGSKPKFKDYNIDRRNKLDKYDILLFEKKSVKEDEEIQSLYEKYFKIQNLISRLYFNEHFEFADFDILSNYLVLFKFNANESIDIIMEIIKNNLANAAKAKKPEYIPYIFDFAYSLKKMNTMSLDQLIDTNLYFRALVKDKFGGDLYERKDNLLGKTGKLLIKNVNEFIDLNAQIKKHYLDKIDTFSKKDLDIIISSLQKLEICEKLIIPIKIVLEKEIDKRSTYKMSKLNKIIDSISKLGVPFEIVSNIRLILEKTIENNEYTPENINDELFEIEDLNLPEEVLVSVNNVLEKNRKSKKMCLSESSSIEKIVSDVLDLCKSGLIANLIKIILNEEVRPNVKEKSDVITDIEYRKIIKELRTYFDFHNLKKIRDLSSDEIIHCIELLVRLKTPLDEIKSFIRISNMDDEDYVNQNLSLLNDKNPITLYLELYDKLLFYKNKLNYNMKYLEDCLKSIFICDDEDYNFYKSEIEKELEKMLVMLPQTYEYEIYQKSLELKK